MWWSDSSVNDFSVFLCTKSESESHSVMSNSLQPHGLYHPWNSSGQNTGVGVAFPFSKGSCQLRDQTQVSCIAGGLFFFFFFNWRLVTLQYCSGFVIHWHESAMGVHVPHPEPPSLLPPHPIPLCQPSAPALSTLSHASNLDWRSVSHMIMYMFQCYSLISSHPCLLPVSVFSLSSPLLSIFGQSLKDFSLHLSFFYYLAYRLIITIFLNSIYMHWYTELVFFFLTYFTLYNRLQFHPPH